MIGINTFLAQIGNLRVQVPIGWGLGELKDSTKTHSVFGLGDY